MSVFDTLNTRHGLRRGRRNAARRDEVIVAALHLRVARWLKTPAPDQSQRKLIAPTLSYARDKTFDGDLVATYSDGIRTQ